MIRYRPVLCLLIFAALSVGEFHSSPAPAGRQPLIPQGQSERQQQSSTETGAQPHQPIRLQSQLVLLDALVVNKKTWKPVGDLQREDFLLYEDRVHQQISHFSRDQLPLSLLLLIDVSGSVRPLMDEIHLAALQALGKLKQGDEVALMAFATNARLVQGFGGDPRLIAEKIKGVQDLKGVGRGTFINNAMHGAAKYVRGATEQTDRRVIIVVSDDVDSSIPFKGHSRSEAVEQLYESGITVCGILVGGAAHQVMRIYSKINPMVFLMRQISKSGSIKGYAARTGGIVASANGKDIKQAFVNLIDLLRARYTIGYYPSNSHPDGKFRKIKLQLKKSVKKMMGNVAVQTRRGYYASRRADREPDVPPARTLGPNKPTHKRAKDN